LAKAHGLFLLEDAACSVGGSYHAKPCGAFGDVAVFSLHARKGVTSGEGGVVVTDDDQLAASVRKASCFGMRSAYTRQSDGALQLPSFEDLGYNYKLSDVLAAIARSQLLKLEEFLAARQRLAARYAELLQPFEQLTPPSTPKDREGTWQTYAVTLDEGVDRDRLILALRGQGIGSNIGTYALSREPVYAAPHDCPVSHSLFARHLALPMFPSLSDEEQDRVVEALAKSLAS
jgi:dTDP-4-amino-4,6-dideoxygalactose transaminase